MIVYKIKYEFVDLKQNWTTHVLADNGDDALQFLRKVLGRDFNLTGQESLCTINAVTDMIMEKIGSVYMLNHPQQTVAAKTVKEVKYEGEKKKETSVLPEAVPTGRKKGPKPGSKRVVKKEAE